MKDETYDFAKVSGVLQAMDLLRGEAVTNGVEEIVTMVDASFRLLLIAYESIVRYEMTRLTGTGTVQ